MSRQKSVKTKDLQHNIHINVFDDCKPPLVYDGIVMCGNIWLHLQIKLECCIGRHAKGVQHGDVDTLFEKSNFCPKIQFWTTPTFSRVFPPIFFGRFFLWNQSCQQLKSPKPQHFHEIFTQKNRIFGQQMKISNSVQF